MPKNYEQLDLFIGENPEPNVSYFDEMSSYLDVNSSLPGWPDEFGNALYDCMKKQIEKPIKTLSLFSGGGGLDIGFHDSGFDVFQMVEIDNRFFETLSVNSSEEGYFKNAEPICIDIREFDPPDDMEVDFIIGGPPCQTFSAAGRRAAGVSGTDDPRGTLFQEYVRILEKLQPKGFLFENVYGILGAQGGKPWLEIVQAFKSVGYNINYRILDTADYGVPQHRERLIIVGVKDGDFLFPTPSHGPDSLDNREYYTPEIAVKKVMDLKPEFIGGKYGHLLKDIPPGLNYSFYTEKLGHPNPLFAWRSKFSDFLYKADPEMPIRTLKAQGGKYTGPFHWEARPFSLGELKRLQTFPDNYNFSGGKQTVIMQIGNSVPPQFVRMLALSVLDQIFNVDLPFEIKYLKKDAELGFRKRKRNLTKIYQQKANDAIIKLEQSAFYDYDNSILNETDTSKNLMRGYIGNNFLLSLENENEENREWNISLKISEDKDVYYIFVGDLNERFEGEALFTIEVEPLNNWNLPYNKVVLSLFSYTSYLYTSAWKTFEFYLFKKNLKADLVQLNGYYQYVPQLKFKVIEMDHSNDSNKTFVVIKHILNGIGTREILKLEELSYLWDLSSEEVIEILLNLRELGYEIRSEYTNNQIPSGHVLIPYAFPTLSPQSVQLKKELFPSKEGVSIR